jgi:hypothetical protein
MPPYSIVGAPRRRHYMLSSLTSIQIKLQASYVVVNCSSNFHSLLRRWLTKVAANCNVWMSGSKTRIANIESAQLVSAIKSNEITRFKRDHEFYRNLPKANVKHAVRVEERLTVSKQTTKRSQTFMIRGWQRRTRSNIEQSTWPVQNDRHCLWRSTRKWRGEQKANSHGNEGHATAKI